MKIKDYTIEVYKANTMCIFKKGDYVRFTKKNHYSGKIARYTRIWAGLYHKGTLIGVMQLGTPCSKNAEQCYAPKGKLIELKRLCLVDEAPKNSESWFIGAVLRHMKKYTGYTHVLSYADLEEKHEGTIYKASNFDYLGKTKFTNKVMIHNDKKIPIRTAYNKKLPLYKEIRAGIVKGTSYLKATKAKNIYVYNMDRKKR